MMVHAFNPSPQEAKKGDLWVQGQPGQSKYQDSQSYTEEPCHKTNKQTKNKKKVYFYWQYGE